MFSYTHTHTSPIIISRCRARGLFASLSGWYRSIISSTRMLPTPGTILTRRYLQDLPLFVIITVKREWHAILAPTTQVVWDIYLCLVCPSWNAGTFKIALRLVLLQLKSVMHWVATALDEWVFVSYLPIAKRRHLQDRTDFLLLLQLKSVMHWVTMALDEWVPVSYLTIASRRLFISTQWGLNQDRWVNLKGQLRWDQYTMLLLCVCGFTYPLI
jgi:hypothetical protein